MKFCGKCHRMVMTKPLTNANNFNWVCYCDPGRNILVSGSAVSSIRANVSGLTGGSSRKDAMRIVRKVEQDVVEVQMEPDNG